MILFCLGTRPELIKLAPVVGEFDKENIPYEVLFTGQHKELLSDVKSLMPPVERNLNIMKRDQTLNYVLASVIDGVDRVIEEIAPKVLIVQGDTTTVLGAALAAFNRGVAVGHVEAGLRTHDLTSPFPEEANRQLVSRIATFNWAPTQRAADMLMSEGVARVNVTGNTVIDGCRLAGIPFRYGNKVLITLHRRENFGPKMKSMAEQVEKLAQAHSNLEFVFPMHPNPNVRKYQSHLKAVKVCDPLAYGDLLNLLAQCRFVISDSGGIQEECAFFRKKVLVCRNTTERPEGVEAGIARLVHDRIEENFDWANDSPEVPENQVYGDGFASRKILEDVVGFLK